MNSPCTELAEFAGTGKAQTQDDSTYDHPQTTISLILNF